MKHLKSLFAVIAVLIATMSVTAPAQITTSFVQPNVSSKATVTIHANVDSLTTYTSGPFGLSGYDAESFYTYPLAYGKKLASAGTPKISAYIDGSYGFSTWTVVDTILTTDSVTTFASGTLDLNNKHFPQYRVRIIGATGNRRDSQVDLVL